MPTLMPSNQEWQRLQALRDLEPSTGAASGPDPDLVDLVEAAALVCGMPISLVTLVGEDKQWFKAQLGLEGIHETARKVAFCAHTILQDQVLEINDAHIDPRFASNPLVTEAPGIRFYAGAPLTTKAGQNVGSLCVIDTKPGLLTENQRQALLRLSKVATHILETKRTAHDQALIAAELTALNQAAPMGLYAANSAGNCTHVNATWLKIYGQTTLETLGDGWVQRLQPDERARVWQAWRQCVETGDLFDQEFRVTHPDGSERFVRSVARRVTLGHGLGTGFVGSVEDVTVLRDQTRRLDSKRERLNLIVQATGVATLEWNEHTKELRPGPLWAQLSGRDLADFAGTTSDTLIDWVHPEDRQTVRQALADAAVAPSGEIEVEFRKRHKLGHWIWILMRARVATRMADGSPEWIFASQIDVTARKLADADLLRSERLLSKMGEVAGVGGWDLDLETNHLTWTDETRRIHGVDPNYQPDVASAIDFYAPASRPVILAAIKTAIRTGAAYDLELQLIRADGTVIWVRAAGSVTRVGDKTTHIYGAFQDITGRVSRQQQLVAEHQRVVLATDSSGIGIWEVNLATGRLTWDRQMFRLYGLFDETALPDAHMVWDQGLHPDDRARIDAAVAEAIAGNRRFEAEFRVQWPDGTTRHIRTLAEVVPDPRSDTTILLGVNWDVTQLRTLSAELAGQHEWMRVTLRSIGDAVITTDDLGVVTWLNPVAEVMTGWGLTQAMGRPVKQIFNILNETTLQPAPNPVETCLAEGRVVALAAGAVLISRSGQQFGIEDSAAPIRDDKGGILGVVMVFHDVTSVRRLNGEIAFRATHDALTGLKNRSEFEIRLRQVLQQAQSGDGQHCLLFIDLDHFKLVNDSCGHAAGDKVLQEVARILGGAIRAQDTLARIGGDEFAVILENCAPEHASRIAQKICDQMDVYRYTHDGRSFRVGTSIGIVAIDDRWPSFEVIVQAADSACLSAKESGRNCIRLWQELDISITHRRDEVGWAARLEQALDTDQFRLFVQEIKPIDPAYAGRHGEVLLRLQESDGSLTLPGQFMPSAERFNLTNRIDWLVLQKSVRMLQDHSRIASLRSLSVNVSARSLADRSFHRTAIECLTAAGPNVCRRLVLEITETSAVSDLVNARFLIEQLHAIEVRVSLDDFGAGAASFGYLRALKVDCLKIDGQFVQGLTNDPLSQATVKCFVDVAQVLGIPTVAEYVDGPEVLETLTRIGVSMVQGLHIAHPVPLTEFLGAL